MGFRSVDSYVHNARLWRRTSHRLVEIVGLLRMWHVREMICKFSSIRGRKAGDEIDAVLLVVVAIALHAMWTPKRVVSAQSIASWAGFLTHFNLEKN